MSNHLWPLTGPETLERGLYIAVTGNTGAGKSTLVRHLAERLDAASFDAIGINERCLHHPLLPLMFRRPESFALGVQLNFMIQRYLMLFRWLELKQIVVIERSHLDDPLYMETHLALGHVTNMEFKAYKSVFSVISARLPPPDYVVFLDAAPGLSLERLQRDEEDGVRPKEFPNDRVKVQFVEKWAGRFREHYDSLVKRKASGKEFGQTIFKSWPAEKAVEEVVFSIMEDLQDVDRFR